MKETSSIWPQDIQAGDSTNTTDNFLYKLQRTFVITISWLIGLCVIIRYSVTFLLILGQTPVTIVIVPFTCLGFVPPLFKKLPSVFTTFKATKAINQSSLKILMEDQEYIIWEKKYVIISMVTEGAKPLGAIIFMCVSYARRTTLNAIVHCQKTRKGP